MKTKFNYLLVLLLAVPLAFSNCSSSDKDDDTKALELNPKALVMELGKTGTVEITGNGDYKVTSSKEEVATATIAKNTMTVVANSEKEGEAILTVTDSKSKKATLKVTVTKEIEPATKIEVVYEGDAVTLTERDAKTLEELGVTVKFTPENATNKDYLLKVLDENQDVVEVDNETEVPTIKGLKIGNVTIQVVANDKNVEEPAKFNLEVKEATGFDRTNWTAKANNTFGEVEDENNSAKEVLDNDFLTIWHCDYVPGEGKAKYMPSEANPHIVDIDMKKLNSVAKVVLSRRMKSETEVWSDLKLVEVWGSKDGSEGSFNKLGATIDFGGVELEGLEHRDGKVELEKSEEVQFIQLRITASNRNGYTSISEVKVF